jgi:hypothetical protein
MKLYKEQEIFYIICQIINPSEPPFLSPLLRLNLDGGRVQPGGTGKNGTDRGIPCHKDPTSSLQRREEGVVKIRAYIEVIKILIFGFLNINNGAVLRGNQLTQHITMGSGVEAPHVLEQKVFTGHWKPSDDQ